MRHNWGGEKEKGVAIGGEMGRGDDKSRERHSSGSIVGKHERLTGDANRRNVSKDWYLRHHVRLVLPVLNIMLHHDKQERYHLVHNLWMTSQNIYICRKGRFESLD